MTEGNENVRIKPAVAGALGFFHETILLKSNPGDDLVRRPSKGKVPLPVGSRKRNEATGRLCTRHQASCYLEQRKCLCPTISIQKKTTPR